MGWITEAVTILDEQMAQNYSAYVETIINGWYEAYNESNAGAQSIITSHMFPAAVEHCRGAAAWWPYGLNADDYLASMNEAFESDVVQRCFARTIAEQYDECSALQEEAVTWQHEHEALVAIIGDSFEPHSVATDWMGTMNV